MIANVRRPGTTSRNSSSFLPPASAIWLERPVTLPPGRAKLATMPPPTGSAATANTIGIIDVAFFTARQRSRRNDDIHFETHKLCRDLGIALTAPLRPAVSIATERPSVQPSSRSRCVKAVTQWLQAGAVAAPRNPIRVGTSLAAARPRQAARRPLCRLAAI